MKRETPRFESLKIERKIEHMSNVIAEKVVREIPT